MKKTENTTDLLANAKWLLGLGIALCFLAPLILTQPAIKETFDFTNTGSIGDTIGGTTAPFINMIGSILVFFALKAQIDANKLIQKQFDDQKTEELNRRKLLYITEQVNIIRLDVNEFTFTYKKNENKYNYKSSDAIFQFLKSISGGAHNISYDEYLKQNPKIVELKNLLEIFNKQILIIERENISELDKEYFMSILEYQYNSKIRQPLFSCRKYKKSEQIVCNGCNEKHGIPDELFDESDKIEKKLQIKNSRQQRFGAIGV